MDIEKQILYWKNSSSSDVETAELLLKSGKILEGLFFCHLAAEKMLKALIVNATHDHPPKTHDLEYLLQLSDETLEEKQTELLRVLMVYQLEGRYPKMYPKKPDTERAAEILNETKNLLQCLDKMF